MVNDFIAIVEFPTLVRLNWAFLLASVSNSIMKKKSVMFLFRDNQY